MQVVGARGINLQNKQFNHDGVEGDVHSGRLVKHRYLTNIDSERQNFGLELHPNALRLLELQYGKADAQFGHNNRSTDDRTSGADCHRVPNLEDNKVGDNDAEQTRTTLYLSF